MQQALLSGDHTGFNVPKQLLRPAELGGRDTFSPPWTPGLSGSRGGPWDRESDALTSNKPAHSPAVSWAGTLVGGTSVNLLTPSTPTLELTNHNPLPHYKTSRRGNFVSFGPSTIPKVLVAGFSSPTETPSRGWQEQVPLRPDPRYRDT